ncbi:MAG: hypothetical protein ACJ8BW_15445, partial [Ktedonobacteraceae bacterium]
LRPGARPRWTAGVHHGRSAARVPVRQSPAPADHTGLAAGPGRTRVPGRRQPDSRASCGPANLGGVPGRPGEFVKRQQV